ncbi:MAG TPA: ATP-binding protein [Chloroflexota bacterium]
MGETERQVPGGRQRGEGRRGASETAGPSAEVEAERARLEAILEHTPSGVLFYDARLDTVRANAEAVRVLGQVTPERGQRQFLGRVCRPDGRPLRQDEFPSSRALRGQPVTREELLVVRPDGQRIPVVASAAPVRDARGSAIGVVVVFQDISERKRVEEERARLFARERQARAEAEEARRRLELFMGVVAHDLRGPLTAIRGYAQLLQRGAPEERRARALQVVVDQVDHMERLIGDLLDFSRIVAGRIRVSPRSMDLVELARRVVDARQLTTTRHRILLEAPPTLVGVWDGDRLAQVLTNLVDNAVKYSPDGGTVWVRLRSLDGEVEIAVTDRGVGLTPDELRVLFRPFVRLERWGTLKGAGLGLFITKGIVEAHGGRLWAESAGKGKGSTFRVVLPRRSAPPPA